MLKINYICRVVRNTEQQAYLVMEAFSFIPFLEIWYISSGTGISDTSVHAFRIYENVYRFSVGCRFILYPGLPEPLKQITLTVPTLSLLKSPIWELRYTISFL